MDIIKSSELASHFDVARAISVEGTDILADLSSKYRGKIIVLKPGGEVIQPEFETRFDVADSVLRDIYLLKKLGAHPILVHGGGKQIERAIQAAIQSGAKNIFNEKIDGLRIVNEAGLKISRGVASGMRGDLVDQLTMIGTPAKIRGVEISGPDVVQAFPLYDNDMRTGTLGFEQFMERGDYEGLKQHISNIVSSDYLRKIAEDPNCIPVIDWHAAALDGSRLTVNADEIAVAVAVAMNADRLVFLSCDKSGQYRGVHTKDGDLVSSMDVEEALALIQDGTAIGGMKTKLENAITAIKCGVHGVAAIDPSRPGAVKQELGAKRGAGTLIVDRNEIAEFYPHITRQLPADLLQRGLG